MTIELTSPAVRLIDGESCVVLPMFTIEHTFNWHGNKETRTFDPRTMPVCSVMSVIRHGYSQQTDAYASAKTKEDFATLLDKRFDSHKNGTYGAFAPRKDGAAPTRRKNGLDAVTKEYETLIAAAHKAWIDEKRDGARRRNAKFVSPSPELTAAWRSNHEALYGANLREKAKQIVAERESALAKAAETDDEILMARFRAMQAENAAGSASDEA